MFHIMLILKNISMFTLKTYSCLVFIVDMEMIITETQKKPSEKNLKSLTKKNACLNIFKIRVYKKIKSVFTKNKIRALKKQNLCLK